MGMLREQLENADHLVLVLPSVVALVENASDEEFRSILQPELKRIINMTKPVQVSQSITKHNCKGKRQGNRGKHIDKDGVGGTERHTNQTDRRTERGIEGEIGNVSSVDLLVALLVTHK